MRLGDQQHLGIRSSPRQCTRSKFLHSSHAPHGSSPSPAAGMIQLWLCSLGHPTPPGTLCHLQLRKFNVLLSPSDYRKTEAAILCGTIAQEGFFYIIVDKIRWKYTWTIRFILNVGTGPCSPEFVSKLRTSSSNKNNPMGTARR